MMDESGVRQAQNKLKDSSETGLSRPMVDSSRDVMDNPRPDDPCLPGELMTPDDPSPKILGDGGRIAPSSSVLLHPARKSVLSSPQHASPPPQSPRPTHSLAQTGQQSAQRQRWSHSSLLHFSLVADGFLRDVLRLTPWVSAVAQRQAAQLARTRHHDAERPAAPPTRFKSRLHHSRFQGPTARKDVEESERQRWQQLLADLLIGTIRRWEGSSRQDK